MPMPVRTRYTVLILAVGVIALLYFFFPPLPSDALSLSAASAAWWSKDRGHIDGLPSMRGGSSRTKQQSLSPPEKKKNERKKKRRRKRPRPKTDLALTGFDQPQDTLEREFAGWHGPDHQPRSKPRRKSEEEEGPPPPPVPDPFPLLTHPPRRKGELARLLRPPGPNAPPPKHIPEATPLLIGFTRNWPQLLQCVASYIAAGWPPEDIYVVENTGIMFANRDGRLSLQNPFYLNHTQLAMLGVNIIVAPTLLTFAQLQNYYLWTALERNWTDYFWSHQDVLVFSREDETVPANPTARDDDFDYDSESESGRVHLSLYGRAVTVLRGLRQREQQEAAGSQQQEHHHHEGDQGAPFHPYRWANHFFAYDHLTLVHRDAHLAVGGWDTHIPFYATDCDMYDRLAWAGYAQGETRSVGIVLDVATVLDDVAALFHVPGVRATFAGDKPPTENEDEDQDEDGDGRDRNQDVTTTTTTTTTTIPNDYHYTETFDHLVAVGRRMQRAKYADGGGARNAWQTRQTGGRGEPFYRDPGGFETGLRMLIETGRRVFAEKWGHRGCDIAQMGIRADDAWRLERDWDPETEGSGSDGPDW